MKDFYIKYKISIAAILFLILLCGFFSLENMKTGLFPDITFPKIKIIAENGQQPVQKMMIMVTMPIENAIKKVPDLNIIRSITSRGSCEISAFFHWNTDIDLRKEQIESSINEIKQDLPPGISVTVEKMNPSILQVMGYSLEGEGRSQVELRQIAEYTVKPYLSKVDGVAEIAVIGSKVKEYHVTLNLINMSNLGITPQEVADVLTRTNFISSNGYVSDYNRLYLSITDASLKNIEDIENTIIQNTPKRAIRLKDISKVEISERRDYVKIKANGKDIPIIGVIKQPEANLIEVCSNIQQRVKELNNILPKGVELKPWYNQAEFVSDSVKSLRDVLWIGLLLALLVTVLFLRSIKASSVILFTIPVTLSLSLLMVYVFGYTFNIMTIGAIAASIGLIIDDAIVVVEQIHRTHEENPGESSFMLVRKAIDYLFPAMVGSSLSTIVIFLPFIFMSGVAGDYFKVLTNTMIIILVCSFFVTWIGLPVIYILFSKEIHSIKVSSKAVKRRTWVKFFIEKPVIAIIFSILLIVSVLFILPRLPSGFLPDMDEGSIVMDFKSPPGTSLEETNKMLNNADKILEQTPEVDSYSRRLGTQMGFFITEPNVGDYLIKLKKKRSKTTMEVADVIRKKIESSLPSLIVDFGQVIGDQLGDLMSSVQPIEVKLYGDDEEVLKKYAVETAGIVDGVRGTADVFNGITIAGPEIIVEPDTRTLAQYNIAPDAFKFEVQNKIEGNIVGSVIENNRLTNIRTIESEWGQAAFDKEVPVDKAYLNNTLSLNDIKSSQIILPSGRLKPISDFAKIYLIKGVAEVERENLKPMIPVTARLNNRDLGSTLKEIQEKIHKAVTLPGGYNIEYGGAYAEQQNAFKELLYILIMASLLVFIVILFLFRSLKVSLLIIGIAVLGMAGCLAGLMITGTPLNVGSYTGIIMIIGIIGENSIFTYLQYKLARNDTGRDEAIIYSISTRLRPKLMTALGAITALFPLALGIGTGAQMHQPLAIAIIGGLIVALPLLLIVLPSMLRIIEK
jgi:CzcA family heavy metal efflux pump